MFTTKRQLKEVIKDVLGGGDKILDLKIAIQKLKDELAELQTTKKMEEREIRHLVKLKEEKLDIEYKKKELELKNTFKDKEMAMQTDYHDKVLASLDKAKSEMQDIYKEILKRLPNVNMEIKKKG